MDVMTTNVMKEKFRFIACAFVSDHLQKDNNKKMIYTFRMRLSKLEI